MEDLVSIIVPVYNVENFISRCITSILEQTYRNFELILLNDGSTDKSGKICDDFNLLDNRIIVIHKKNSGVSDTRNWGINIAKGTYICFIDADDYIEKEYLNKLIENRNADLVASGYTRIDGMQFFPKEKFYDSYQIKQVLSELINIPLLDTPWCKLFKKSLIDENNIRFDTKLKFGEDQIFVRDYILSCNNLQVLSNAGYIYYIQPNEIRKKKFNISMDEFIYRCDCELDRFNRLEKKFKCKIDTRNKMCFISFVHNLYIQYTDEYCWKIYSKYHPLISKNEYFNNTLACPINSTISELKDLYKNKRKLEAYTLESELKQFLTVSTRNIKFSSNINKLIHYSIVHNQIFLLKILKHLLYFIK